VEAKNSLQARHVTGTTAQLPLSVKKVTRAEPRAPVRVLPFADPREWGGERREHRRRSESRVIPWEDGTWSVAIRYSNRTRVAYPIGSREDAERELLRPRVGAPKPVADAPACRFFGVRRESVVTWSGCVCSRDLVFCAFS
jgi:hypothetical protein